MRSWLAAVVLTSAVITIGAQTTDQLQPIAPVTPTCPSGQAGSILVNGNGDKEAISDQAQVVIRVAVSNSTASGARDLAAVFANQTIVAVRTVQGVYPNNVTTTSFTINPITSKSGTTGVTSTIGYTATSIISVKISNVTGEQVAQVVGLAISNGGNNASISGITYSLSDVLSYQLTVSARQQAAQSARATAQTYAQTLGLSLGPVLSITDQTTSATPYQSVATSDRASPQALSQSSATSTSTPVEIGTQSVTAAITMVYTLCNTSP